MIRLLSLLLVLWAASAPAQSVPGAGADVVFLGEVHDNPAHHARQAEIVAGLAPAALVFEMLSPEQVAAAEGVERSDMAALAAAFDWAESGWPDFALYHPIIAAAPGAALFGAAIPRAVAREAMGIGAAAAFGEDAALFGLDRLLEEDQQAARETLQMEAHCNALPTDMLPGMVSVQRLRDAALARAALRAFERTGGPVVVITGNGHARTDWGAPEALRLARPELALFSLGQSEDGIDPEGSFDLVLDATSIEREDPCEAFR